MSGFEVFGVVAAAVPLITSALPNIIKLVETLRDSANVRAELLDTVTSLAGELKVGFAILEQLNYEHPKIEWRDQQVAKECANLFRGFPKTVNRLVGECKELLEGPTIRLLLHRRKLDETISELEHQMQHLIRRVTLLVTYLQREIPSANWAARCSVRGKYPSKIRQLLNAQSHQALPTPIMDRNDKCVLYGKYDVGAFFVSRTGPSRTTRVIVETCDFRGKDSMMLGELSAQEVLHKLSIDSPADWLGILTCQTAWWNYRGKKSSNLTILYRTPSMADPNKLPCTLRSVLRHDDDPKEARRSNVPLNIRLRLAREVANAVLFVHVAGLVHKNVRPESILIFFPKDPPKSSKSSDRMGKAFLTGFGESRGADQGSTVGSPMHGNWAEEWERYMYRHPSRVHPLLIKYTMLHDIYALGVTLLEIGVWQSFVGSVKEKVYPSERLADTIRTTNPLWVFNGKVPESQARMKTIFVASARQLLPFSMGEAYTEVVVSCLTCMDGEKQQAAAEGARFIGDVLDRLDEIKM